MWNAWGEGTSGQLLDRRTCVPARSPDSGSDASVVCRWRGGVVCEVGGLRGAGYRRSHAGPVMVAMFNKGAGEGSRGSAAERGSSGRRSRSGVCPGIRSEIRPEIRPGFSGDPFGARPARSPRRPSRSARPGRHRGPAVATAPRHRRTAVPPRHCRTATSSTPQQRTRSRCVARDARPRRVRGRKLPMPRRCALPACPAAALVLPALPVLPIVPVVPVVLRAVRR